MRGDLDICIVHISAARAAMNSYTHCRRKVCVKPLTIRDYVCNVYIVKGKVVGNLKCERIFQHVTRDWMLCAWMRDVCNTLLDGNGFVCQRMLCACWISHGIAGSPWITAVDGSPVAFCPSLVFGKGVIPGRRIDYGSTICIESWNEIFKHHHCVWGALCICISGQGVKPDVQDVVRAV